MSCAEPMGWERRDEILGWPGDASPRRWQRFRHKAARRDEVPMTGPATSDGRMTKGKERPTPRRADAIAGRLARRRAAEASRGPQPARYRKVVDKLRG